MFLTFEECKPITCYTTLSFTLLLCCNTIHVAVVHVIHDSILLLRTAINVLITKSLQLQNNLLYVHVIHNVIMHRKCGL